MVNKAFQYVYFKIRNSGNVSGSGGGSSTMLNVICKKCDKKEHIQRECRYKENDSSGNPPKNPINKIPEYFTNNIFVSDTKELSISTTNQNIIHPAITKMFCGNFTGNNNTRSGKRSNSGIILFTLMIMLPMK